MIQTITSYKDKLTFGKHKGKLFEKVLVESPQYIRWCIEQKVIDIPDINMSKVINECIQDDDSLDELAQDIFNDVACRY